MTSLSNRVVSIYNRKTSMRLAPAEWSALDNICSEENINRKDIIELIDFNRDEAIGLTAAIRLFIIAYYKNFIADANKSANSDDKEFVNPIFEAIKGIVQ